MKPYELPDMNWTVPLTDRDRAFAWGMAICIDMLKGNSAEDVAQARGITVDDVTSVWDSLLTQDKLHKAKKRGGHYLWLKRCEAMLERCFREIERKNEAYLNDLPLS